MISGNLFTRDYLLDGIERTAQWKGLTDETVQSVRQRLHALATKFLKIAKPNEAETEKEFIYPVIEVLGWNEYQVQQILSQKGRKQVPDALLFADLAAKTLAVGEAQQWKRFQHGLAVLEAKRWNRALDRADKKAERGGCSLDADAPVSQPRRCPDQQQGPGLESSPTAMSGASISRVPFQSPKIISRLIWPRRCNCPAMNSIFSTAPIAA